MNTLITPEQFDWRALRAFVQNLKKLGFTREERRNVISDLRREIQELKCN